jgi:hypothetical protein
MAKVFDRNRVGELRPSQILFSFGVGSTIELPHLSVMQMGLDDWDALRCPELEEPRLVRAIQAMLHRPVARLRRPPPQPDSDSPEAQRVGVPVTLFPRWLRCPTCQIVAPVESGVFVLKPNLFRPDRTCYVHENCLKNRLKRPPTVFAARYLVACENGHLDDFPWDYFLHAGVVCPGPLRVFEVGVSGSNSGLFVKCDSCDAQKPLSVAFEREAKPLGACTGRHPHLRSSEPGCRARLRPILVGASNAWFPIRLSVLSIPNRKDPLAELVEVHRDSLQDCQSEREVGLVKKAIPVLSPYPAADIWARLQEKPSLESAPSLKIHEPEWKLFCQPNKFVADRDLTLREVPIPPGFEAWIHQVVLADRLREVHGLVGFTRLESPEEFGDPEEIPEDRQVPLSRGREDWVPAVEIRGEGIFLRFRAEPLRSWSQRGAVLRRENSLFRGHQSWRRLRRLPAPDRGFPAIGYALIHSFAHALMRQLTLECGYAASSLRERIYWSEGDEGETPMAGVLIYTAAPDCDGTLGGLVSLGEPELLGHHLGQALEQMRFCSGDPLCADHLPDQGGLDVHGASCHACLFAPETSCERGNRYLDRNLLVDTIGGSGLAFFEGTGQVEVSVAPPETTLDPVELLPTAQGGLPVFTLQDLGKAAGYRPSAETDDRLFWLQVPDHSLNKIIPAGSWCLFRRLSDEDERPPDDTLCVVGTPDGSVLRRFFYVEQEDADKNPQGARVLLRARSSQPYRTVELEVPAQEWADWRPFAQFAGLEEKRES